MDLRAWLDKQPRGAAAKLARAAGISRVTLHQIAHGLRPCPARIALILDRETGGQVPAKQFPAVQRAVTVAKAVHALRSFRGTK
jgi:hypothetical protein